MTTPAASDAQAGTITYEGANVGFGGYDAAVFMVERPHQGALEHEIRLAMDARRLFEERTGPLDEAARQRILRTLGERFYREKLAHREPIPAIYTVRAAEITADEIGEILRAAALA